MGLSLNDGYELLETGEVVPPGPPINPVQALSTRFREQEAAAMQGRPFETIPVDRPEEYPVPDSTPTPALPDVISLDPSDPDPSDPATPEPVNPTPVEAGPVTEVEPDAPGA